MNCLKQGRSFYELGNAEFPPQVGLFPWAPVIEINVSMPYNEGWYEKDWHFIGDTPENLIKTGEFNRGLKYMTGVTLQEAADYVCKCSRLFTNLIKLWYPFIMSTFFLVDNNESLGPDYVVDERFFKEKVWELVFRYNYTLNLNGTYEAIKYMYTFWPDPHNVTLIREKYIEVCSVSFAYICIMAHLMIIINIYSF